MKSLRKEEASAWCQQKSIAVTKDEYLYFSGSRHCLAIELPDKPYELVALANALLPYSETVPFRGALLWIRQWGVWNELVERAGFRIMEVMRSVHGDARRLEEAPGYLFDAQELVDLQVCLIQPLLIGWDAFMVPESGDYVVATSHDETTCVLARTPQIYQSMRAELQPWNPREDQEWYFKGTAIPAGQG
ncbi:MAG TPA: hypothetical protein VMJ93_07330 [Verrucomicrobiae bacterium]|nr:hypothetical protein [Verrucomicrobiae bacterium]